MERSDRIDARRVFGLELIARCVGEAMGLGEGMEKFNALMRRATLRRASV
jgi:hypothetical protein